MISTQERSTGNLGAVSDEDVGAAELLLIVDDEKEIREIEAQILSLAGYQTCQAENAVQALSLAEKMPIDLLLTDFLMPEVDGLELVRKFRVTHPRTPVLMVSGSLLSMPINSERLGLFEIMPKPFVVGELLNKVRSLLDTAAQPLP